MNDQDIAYLKEQLTKGDKTQVYYMSRCGPVRVTRIGPHQDEPEPGVAWFEDVGYAALYNVGRDDFQVMEDITKWP